MFAVLLNLMTNQPYAQVTTAGITVESPILQSALMDHLNSLDLLSRLREQFTADPAVWPALKNLIKSVAENVEVLRDRSFQKVKPRAVLVLPPGYQTD